MLGRGQSEGDAEGEGEGQEEEEEEADPKVSKWGSERVLEGGRVTVQVLSNGEGEVNGGHKVMCLRRMVGKAVLVRWGGLGNRDRNLLIC